MMFRFKLSCLKKSICEKSILYYKLRKEEILRTKGSLSLTKLIEVAFAVDQTLWGLFDLDQSSFSKVLERKLGKIGGVVWNASGRQSGASTKCGLYCWTALPWREWQRMSANSAVQFLDTGVNRTYHYADLNKARAWESRGWHRMVETQIYSP